MSRICFLSGDSLSREKNWILTTSESSWLVSELEVGLTVEDVKGQVVE